MNREQVNLLLIPQPKDFSPLTFRQPLRVRGSFKDIEVFPDPLKTDERGPLAKAANAVLTAILGLIPPIDSGVGEDSNCQALIQDARERGAAPPRGQARPGQKQQQQPQQGQQREQPGRR